MKFRKKPVVIEAVKWTGENLREVIDFTGLHHSASKWTWEEYGAVVRKDGLKIVAKTVLVRMLCKCGGEMKPTGTCLLSYPLQYPHICNKCGTNATYNVGYPEIRYVTE